MEEAKKKLSIWKLIAWLILGGFVSTIVIAIIICVMAWWGAQNYIADTEPAIKYQSRDNLQQLANFSNGLQEMVQISAVQADLIVKTITAANTARYGADGSKSEWSWIKEANPNVDQTQIGRIQVYVEAQRAEFKNRQTKIGSMCQNYETQQQRPWSGFWLRMVGAPRDKEVAKYCTLILNKYSEDAYNTGKAEAVKLR